MLQRNTRLVGKSHNLWTRHVASLQKSDFFGNLLPKVKFFFNLTVLSLLLLLTVDSPAQAQDDILPDIEYETTLNFPVDVVFNAAVGFPPDQLQGLTLRYSVEGQPEVVVNFPGDIPYEIADTFTSARYTWVFTAETAPLIFGDVNYTWQATTADGTTFETSDSFLFQDERAQWRRSDTGLTNLELVAPTRGINFNVHEIDAELRPVYERLSTETGATPLLRYFIYPTSLPFACDLNDEGEPEIGKFVDGSTLNIICDLEQTRAFYTSSGYIVLENLDEIDVESFIADWVPLFYANAWAEASIPAWFLEGLARFYNEDTDNVLNNSRRTLRTGSPLSLQAMSSIPEDETTRIIWEAQAYGMLIYTARLAGVEAVFELAQTIGEYDNFQAAFDSVIGQPLSSLIPAWETWVFSSQADRDYVYRIYQPATLTPSPTPTITNTPLPPTATDTPTATNTPRPPTRTPTITPVPLTPTPTPLPAQSFTIRITNTPAPVTVDMSPIPGVSQTNFFVIAAAVGVALLVLIGGVIWARNG